MRASLTLSGQANIWATRPLFRCLGGQQGTGERVSLARAGRQTTGKGDAVGGFPVKGVESLQTLPAQAYICGLELRIHHVESWAAWTRLASFSVSVEVVSGSAWIRSPQTEEGCVFHGVLCRDPTVIQLQQLGEEVGPDTAQQWCTAQQGLNLEKF